MPKTITIPEDMTEADFYKMGDIVKKMHMGLLFETNCAAGLGMHKFHKALAYLSLAEAELKEAGILEAAGKPIEPGDY